MIQRVCDVCHYYKNGTARRYMVSRTTGLDPGEVPVQLTDGRRFTLSTREGRKSYGAGSIDLCDECWERICKPRMVPKRANNGRANRYTTRAAK